MLFQTSAIHWPGKRRKKLRKWWKTVILKIAKRKLFVVADDLSSSLDVSSAMLQMALSWAGGLCRRPGQAGWMAQGQQGEVPGAVLQAGGPGVLGTPEHGPGMPEAKGTWPVPARVWQQKQGRDCPCAGHCSGHTLRALPSPGALRQERHRGAGARQEKGMELGRG